MLLQSCAPLPSRRYTLESLEFSGDHQIEDGDIEEVIASKQSPRFLGIESGIIYDYEVFDRFVLERDLERIERYYRARGYYRARVRAARVVMKGRGAHVTIHIEEGPALLLQRVDIQGLELLPPDAALRLRAQVTSILRLGRPFEELAYKQATDELARGLADLGFAYAKVRPSADIDLPRNCAAVGFWVQTGPKAVFGDVHIDGLGSFPEPPVRRALDIQPGKPYSQFSIDEAKRALLDLGVFSAVTIEPEFGATSVGNEPVRVPLRVSLERAKLRSVHVGGGVEADSLKTDMHLTTGWEDSNFLGGFRKLKVEVVPGAVVYPTRLPNFERPDRLLPEVKVRGEFRQPGTFEPRTNSVIRSQASVYPVLLSRQRDPAAPVLGYRDVRASAGLERSVWKFYGAVSQNVQVNSPFAYFGLLDSDLGTVVISYPELFATLDARNDRVTPHKGIYLSMDAQFAGLGGDARDVKVQPEARFYVPVARRVTLAARGTIGLLFPQNYGQTVADNANTGAPGNASRATWVKDIQLMYLRGFFSGGSGSNRGYGPREIGPHGVVPFYNPGQTTTACALSNAAVCDLPLGGFTLWEASLELRFPITGPLTAAAFADTSDVAPYLVSFRFDRPHFSVGLGFRYETPVGPVRFDLGFRVPGMQGPSTPDEGQPATTLGLPIAASFGIGESF